MKIPNLAVRKPVAFTCLLVAVLIIGTLAANSLRVDMLPEMDMPEITILTMWNGASPSDVEQRITRTMEDNLSGIEGIKNMTSKSQHNVSSVTLEFEWGVDLDARVGDIRDKLDMAKRDLPDDIEEPMIFRMSMDSMPILIAVVTADESFSGLRRFVEDTLKEEIQRVVGVGNVMVQGGREREISIMLDPEKLEAYRLSPQDIVTAVERENVNMPAGSLKDGTTSYSIRVPARFKSVRDMESVIVTRRNGKPIYLRDVASIRDDFKEQNRYAWSATPDTPIDECVDLMVFKNNDANTVDVIRGVEKRVAAMRDRFPPDAHYQVVFNQAEEIENSIDSLIGTLFQGLALVFLITWFFMKRFLASVVICVSIPTSLLLTCIMMWLMGYSMNVFTLMALAMAVGLVVDNAIVSMDQIMYHMELGKPRDEAAVLGASEVGGALLGSTSTSVVVLMPLFFAGGMVGIFFSSLGAVMASSIFCSFLVAISFVPMLASKIRSAREDNFFVHRYSEKLLRRLERTFRVSLDWSLGHKTAVLVVAVLFMGCSIKGAGYIGTELTPATDSGEVEISYQLAEGTRGEETDAMAREIMTWVQQNVPELMYTYAECGEDDSGFGSIFGDTGSNVGSVSLKLVKKKDRNRSSFAVAQELREMLATKEAFQSVTVMVNSGMTPSGGKPFVIEVYGQEMDEILNSAERIKEMLAGVPGAVDVTVEQKPATPEIWVQVDREKASLMGIDTAQVAKVLRTLFYGTEATEKYWEGEDDYGIFVRMDTNLKHDLRVLERLVMINDSGEAVRLSSIADVTHIGGPSEISRKNRQRYVTVEANLFGRSLGEVLKDVQTKLGAMELPRTITLGWGGDVSDQDESFDKFGILLVLAVILCYMVMAAQYEAYSDPLIIMLTVPFAFTGVIVVFLALNLYVSMQVVLGMLMLVGVVVNHAIIYLDYVNLLRSRGTPLRKSLLEAAERRLRPILMTVLSTCLGMLPLAFSNGEGAEQWNTMAICYISGLLVSMTITLILVPVVYHLVEAHLRRKLRFAEAGLAKKDTGEMKFEVAVR